MITGMPCTQKIRRLAADSLSLSYPPHRLEDGWWPGPTGVYRAPAAVKAGATLGGAPGLTRVTPDQEGPQDDPGGHHMAALAPPRTSPGTPREREDRPDCPKRPQDGKTHQSVSTATPDTQGLSEVTPGRL